MEEIEQILEYYPPEEQAKIIESYNFAKEVLKDKVRENGHPFIEHPIGVAKIIAAEVGLQYDAIIAIFIHESIRFNPDLVISAFVKKYPPQILEISESLNKISKINLKHTKLNADLYKSIIVSVSDDPRVTLIKLADRLEVMRNLKYFQTEEGQKKREKKIIETSLLYIPIAHQLGLYRLKAELEEICFTYSDPENYRTITNLLKATEPKREKFINSFIEPIKTDLQSAGIKCTIKSRTKTAFSIWKKMQKQKIPFEEVYDIFAIRVIIDAPDDRKKELSLCWVAYSIVSKRYETDPKRLRDWLSKPKENGYESLHTTISDKNGNIAEVQIRTKRMDDMAESGHASHWSYKGIKENKGLNQWLGRIKDSLESKEKGTYSQEFIDTNKDLFVLTKDGDLRKLPAGSTVLDLAFDIHTNLGCHCTGAIIKGKAVSIKERLLSGDVIEIMKNNNQRPTPDWLNIVVTSKAKNKIKQKLNEEKLKKAAVGKELLDRRIKNWKLESINDEDLTNLRKKYKYESNNDLFSAISEEKIELSEIKDYLTTKSEETNRVNLPQIKPSQGNINDTNNDNSDYIVIDGSISNVSYKMAKCCNPIFGDQVFGFVTVRNGITIHRASCPNATRLIEKYPYRVRMIKWKTCPETTSFQATLKINLETSSPFASILNTIEGFNAPLRSSKLTQREGMRKGEFTAIIQIFVTGNQQLDKITSAIKKTKGVTSVQRTN